MLKLCDYVNVLCNNRNHSQFPMDDEIVDVHDEDEDEEDVEDEDEDELHEKPRQPVAVRAHHVAPLRWHG